MKHVPFEQKFTSTATSITGLNQEDVLNAQRLLGFAECVEQKDRARFARLLQAKTNDVDRANPSSKFRLSVLNLLKAALAVVEVTTYDSSETEDETGGDTAGQGTAIRRADMVTNGDARSMPLS